VRPKANIICLREPNKNTNEETKNNKSSAVADMGDRLATIDMAEEWGGAAMGAGSSLDPHLT